MIPQTAQFEDITLLEEKLKKAILPQELRSKASAQIERLVRIASTEGFTQEYDSVSRYIEWIVSLPWDKRTTDTSSLENARKILDANHFGLRHVKDRILEYIAVSDLKGQSREKPKSPLLLLLGLVGTGKTTMASSIAQALGRQFGRIPMGGMGDALQLRGRSRSYPGAEPGQIMKVLRRVQAKNPVILLDEIDRVTDEAKADIMGVLVELLDSEQNSSFMDHFIDYPFDLSEVFFISTANNTGGIATAVLDRLEMLEMPSYSDQEKITIGKTYLLPRALASSGLSAEDVVFSDNVWALIVRPLGFDAGMRTLDRTIEGVCRKVAKLKVEGKITRINLTEENIKEYLPA